MGDHCQQHESNSDAKHTDNIATVTFIPNCLVNSIAFSFTSLFIFPTPTLLYSSTKGSIISNQYLGKNCKMIIRT